MSELNSEYWKSEIERTDIALAQLISDEASIKKTSTGNGDELELQSISDTIERYRFYLAHCKSRYNEALIAEKSENAKPHITYIGR